MPHTSNNTEGLKWSVTLWHSVNAHPNWRHWKLLYTNRELDSIMNRPSADHVGLQGGVPEVCAGFDEDHFGQFFQKALNSREIQECVLRFSHPEAGVEEIYLLFYLKLLDDRHMSSIFIPVDKIHVPENFNEFDDDPIRGTEYYGLPASLMNDLEEEIAKLKTILPQQ